MNTIRTTAIPRRLGFHYFPDTLHYRESDLRRWLPELEKLGAAWLTLATPLEYAIPEDFIHGMLTAQIQPVLHFHFKPDMLPQSHTLLPLFRAYARWGVQYVAFFDRPNLRSSWPAEAWARGNLVERFLDAFLPVAEAAAQHGLAPLFPPLAAGGDYWDLAFLQAALRGLKRRASRALQETLMLGIEAWLGGRPLDWGAGGPERWPGVRPYITPPGEQDQRGFHVFDWHLAIAEAELGRRPQGVILRAGVASGAKTPGNAAPEDPESALPLEPNQHAAIHQEIARRLHQVDDASAQTASPIPPEILACNFWLLACEPPHPLAWFGPEHSLPAVSALQAWAASTFQAPAASHRRPIDHYLLLPSYDWGVADWHLEATRAFIKRSRPTLGFSAAEAALARRVTVIGADSFSPETLDGLRAAGCVLDCLPDGTQLATLLAELTL